MQQRPARFSLKATQAAYTNLYPWDQTSLGQTLTEDLMLADRLQSFHNDKVGVKLSFKPRDPPNNWDRPEQSHSMNTRSVFCKPSPTYKPPQVRSWEL